MGVAGEFDRGSHPILLDGEYRRAEATGSRDVIDPATGNVVAEITETSAPEFDTGPFGSTRMSGMDRRLGAQGFETNRRTGFAWLDPNCGTRDFR